MAPCGTCSYRSLPLLSLFNINLSNQHGRKLTNFSRLLSVESVCDESKVGVDEPHGLAYLSLSGRPGVEHQFKPSTDMLDYLV